MQCPEFVESRNQILPGPSPAQRLYQKALGSRLLIASTVVNVYHCTAANELITLLNTILSCISEHLNSGEEDNVNNTAFVCPTPEPQGVGRPAIVVNEDQIQFLRSLHFKLEKNCKFTWH